MLQLDAKSGGHKTKNHSNNQSPKNLNQHNAKIDQKSNNNNHYNTGKNVDVEKQKEDRSH